MNKQEQELVVLDGKRVLADRRQRIRSGLESKGPQRRELIPVLGFVAEYPLDRLRVVIERDDEVLRLETMSESSEGR